MAPHVYFGQWQWLTDPDDGGRWAAPVAGNVGCLDLRSLSDCGTPGPAPSGWGVFSYPGPVLIPGAIHLGNDMAGAVSPVDRAAIRARLGLPQPIAGTSLVDVLWKILTVHADPTGQNRPKPLMPTMGGRLDLHLGGFSLIQSKPFSFSDPEGANVLAVFQEDYRRIRQERRGQPEFMDTHRRVLGELVKRFGGDYRRFIPSDLPDEGALTPHTTILDNFNRADADPLGTSSEGWSWTEVLSDTDIVSNQAKDVSVSGNRDMRNRAESDLSTSDHYSQAAVSIIIASTAGGIGVRYAAAADTHYRYLAKIGEADRHVLAKIVTGTITSLATDDTNQFTTGGTQRLEVNGSTLTGMAEGVTRITVTDTAITGNLRGGINGRNSGAGRNIWDNFEAADLAAADPFPAGYQRRIQHY